MGRKKGSDRATRREALRAAQKLGELRGQLAALEPGGSPGRPRDVESPAVIDVHAISLPCTACEGELELLEHTVVEHAGQRLRQAHLRCRRCGTDRDVFYKLTPTLKS